MLTRRVFLTLWVLLLARPGAPTSALQFEAVSLQGFGDRHNTKAWSMAWWQGRLYVGTARAHLCLSRAGISLVSGPSWLYPPRDPELACTEDMHDLPLQGEIWRYAPDRSTWERVFVSPLIPNPAVPGRQTARDAGFRALAVFVESDGTEALYALGVTSESIHPGMPPPRILRTTDGVTWQPVPQEPNTFLGELGRGQASFRAAHTFGSGLYAVNGDLLGAGRLIESLDPASGGDSFRSVSPEGLTVFELSPFNGALYVGTVASRGYSVLRTGATGAVPYSFTPVIENGGYTVGRRPRGPASMYVSGGRLYIGTDSPAEIVRINPDDSWDLVVGRPRWTPEGRKEPLSGLGPGFDYGWANHVHRMVEHAGSLYVSLNDAAGFTLSGGSRRTREASPLSRFAGFDLFSSTNGVEYSVVTLTGFGDPRENVIRSFASTPHGLFAGTANPWHGLRVYQGTQDTEPAPGAPRHVNAEATSAGIALTWEPVGEAVSYRVLRRNVREGPGFEEIGTSNEAFFADAAPERGVIYHYFVQAVDAAGASSAPSNLARAPSLRRQATLAELEQSLQAGTERRSRLLPLLGAARRRLRGGDLGGASSWLRALRRRLRASDELPAWRAEDAQDVLDRLLHRLRLAEAGFVSSAEIESPPEILTLRN